MVRARILLAGGSTADALLWAEKALKSARDEHSVDPIKDRYRIAATYRLIGDIQRRMASNQIARQTWTAALAQLPANVNERPRELAVRVGLLNRLNRREEAKLLGARLGAMGYQMQES